MAKRDKAFIARVRKCIAAQGRALKAWKKSGYTEVGAAAYRRKVAKPCRGTGLEATGRGR